MLAKSIEPYKYISYEYILLIGKGALEESGLFRSQASYRYRLADI